MPSAMAECSRCESPIEKGDLRCAICGEVVPAAPRERAELAVEILRCRGCDAAVSYDPSVQAPRCAFCDSVMEVERIEDPMEQTELFAPFTVGTEESRRALRKWLGSLGFFRPSDLRSRAKLESLKPIFWVGWIFDARALISWAADSDAGSWRSAWAPHAGQVEMVFDDILVSASRGLSAEETAELTPTYRLSSARPEPGGVEGALIEHFDVQRSLARRRILHGIQRVAKSRVADRHVPGSSCRNLRISVLLRGLSTRRYALPAWVLAYRYKGRLYRAVVSGQDAGCVRGSAPVSWAKVVLVALAVVGLVAIALGIAAASS